MIIVLSCSFVLFIEIETANGNGPVNCGQVTDDLATDDLATDDRATDDRATDDQATGGSGPGSESGIWNIGSICTVTALENVWVNTVVNTGANTSVIVFWGSSRDRVCCHVCHGTSQRGCDHCQSASRLDT